MKELTCHITNGMIVCTRGKKLTPEEQKMLQADLKNYWTGKRERMELKPLTGQYDPQRTPKILLDRWYARYIMYLRVWIEFGCKPVSASYEQARELQVCILDLAYETMSADEYEELKSELEAVIR